MDPNDVAWVQARKGIYQFLAPGFTNDPAFKFVLTLLDQNMERNIQQAELFCPSMIEFKKTLQDWKNDTRVRRKVREDYAQLSQNCNGLKELSKLLNEMALLVTQEDYARKMQQSEQIRQSLMAQKQFLKEQFLPVQRSLLQELQSFSGTAFYRTLTTLVEKFTVRDYEKLSETLAVV